MGINAKLKKLMHRHYKRCRAFLHGTYQGKCLAGTRRTA
jgi:hypothetical protein